MLSRPRNFENPNEVGDWVESIRDHSNVLAGDVSDLIDSVGDINTTIDLIVSTGSFNFKGDLPTADDLDPLVATASVSDAYYIIDTEHVWVFDGVAFVDIGTFHGPPGVDTVPGETTGEMVVGLTMIHPTEPELQIETWLGSTVNGGPTVYAISKLEAAGLGGGVTSVNGETGVVTLEAVDVGALSNTTDIDDLLPSQTGNSGKVLGTNGTGAAWTTTGAVSSVNGQTGDVDLLGAKPVMLSLPYGALRGQPTLSRPIDEPILTLAQAGTTSIFQPQLIDLRLSGGTGATSCGLIWSTDHDSVGGINLATAEHPFGPYTVVGQVYVDTTHGESCETPHAVWDEAEGHWKVYYQMYNTTGGGLSPSSQYTCLATTEDWETFSYVDIVIEGIDNDEHGNQHTGYAVPFKLGDTWISYSLFGGGTALRHAMWQSADGITWYLHPWKTGHNTPQIDHVSGWTPNFRGNIGGAPIWYRGRYWLFTAPVLNFAGVNTDPLPLAVAPLSEDFRHFAGRPISLDVSPVYAWEGDGPTYFGASLMWDEHIYFPYRAGDNDAFGLWEIA